MSESSNQTPSDFLPASWECAPVLLGVLGSTAYGLANAGSDLDRLGVYVAPIEKILGLRARQVIDETFATTSPDITIHELAKFAALALKCNPTVLELLYATHYDVCDEVGLGLVQLRSSFLSTERVRDAYGGYVVGQLKKILSRDPLVAGDEDHAKRTKKNARHCFRLLSSGRQLLASGSMVLDVGDVRDELYAIGELAVTDIDGFQSRVTLALEAFDATVSVLPEWPDRDKVERFVISTRLSRLERD